MIQWSLFYRLLGIPDDVDDPTHYQLLGIDPIALTAEQVDRALTERKKQLRQTIPGPQFIPLVLAFESEQLNVAAADLRDPKRRMDYDRQLARASQIKTSRQIRTARKKIVRQAKALIADAVGLDGTLDADNRFALAQQLSHLNINEAEVQEILSRIPSPGDTKRKSRRASRPDSAEITFFTQAVEFAIMDGTLYGDDVSRLKSLAGHLGIAPMVAESIINGQLVQSQAEKTETLTDLKKSWRTTAIWKTPAQQHLETSKKTLKANKIIGITVLIMILAGFFAMLTWIGVSKKEFARMQQELSLPPAFPSLEIPSAKKEKPLPSPVEATSKFDADAVLGRLLECSSNHGELGRLLEQSDPVVLSQAMENAAQSLRTDSDHEQTASMMSLFRSVFQGHFAPVYQDMTIEALLSACDQAVLVDDAKRPAMLLAEGLFLDASAGVFATQSGRQQFVQACKKAWIQSQQNWPGDPLFDPKRLAESVCTNGNWTLFFTLADKTLFSRVVHQLAVDALDVRSPVRQSALEALFDLAQTAPDRPDYTWPLARMAMCDLLAQTDDPQLAEKVFLKLAQFVRIHDIPELVSSDFNSTAFRHRAGEILKSYFETGTIPDRYRAREFPLFTSTKVLDSSGKDFRSHYSKSDQPDDLLVDLAVTLLACCEQAETFTGRSGTWSQQLNTVLYSGDIPRKISKSIIVTYHADESQGIPGALGTSRAYSPSATLDPQKKSALQSDLESDDLDLRYRAIEQLWNTNSSQTAEMLLNLLTNQKITEHPGSLSRVIRSLRTMDDPDIPSKLIDLIDKTEPHVSFEIVRALMLETEIQMDEQAILPWDNDPQQRKRSADWWHRQWRNGSLSWNHQTAFPPLIRYPKKQANTPNTQRQMGGVAPTAQRPSAGDAKSKLAWLPQRQPLRASAAADRFTEVTAELLTGFQWTGSDEQNGTRRLDEGAPYMNAFEIGKNSLEHLTQVNDQLARLIRTHPRGSTVALQADLALLQDTTNNLLCDTIWQQMAVKLGTQGRLLGILLLLVKESDEQKSALEQMARLRSRLIGVSPTVFHELREHAYYNLVLWNNLNESSKN